VNQQQIKSQIEHMEMILSRLEREVYKCKGELALLRSEALGEYSGNGKEQTQAYSTQAYQRA